MSRVFEPEFTRDVPCALCGGGERPVLRAKDGGRPGVCEACVVDAHWDWHAVPRDSDPVQGDLPAPARVKVLVPRLAYLPDGKTGLPGVPQSYEVAMRKVEGGAILDLPAADLVSGETDYQAASRALEAVGLATFAPCVEILYEAHSASGDFVRVVMVTAFTTVEKKLAEWRPWPPWEHVPSMAGLYLALRSVFELRLWKYQAKEPRLGAVAVELRQGAATYVRTQQELRDKSGAERARVDASMLTYLRKDMTDDERAVSDLISRSEDLLSQKRAEEEVPKKPEEAPAPPQGDLFGTLPEVGSAEVPGDEPGSLEEAFGDEGEGPGDPS